MMRNLKITFNFILISQYAFGFDFDFDFLIINLRVFKYCLGFPYS
jgi:hypothetical protein